MKLRIAALAALAALAAAAEKQPLERYQSVIDRQMFGELPDDFDPTKMPSEVQKTSSKSAKELAAEQEKLKSAIHFSVINVKSDGRVEVGFTDNSDPKEPLHYFICEGETAGGWTVEQADAESATMTISRDGVSLELRLGDNSAKGGGSMKRTGDAAGSAASAPRNSPLLGNGTGGFISARRRREQREAEAAAEDQKRREEEERRRAEREAAEEERNAEREAEREEQRKQLIAIQEELRRVREAKAAPKETKGANDSAE